MNARIGNRRAANQLGTFDRPPWASWRTRSLPGRAIKFMESFCVQRKGHFVGDTLSVARWQRDWLEAVFGGDVEASLLTLGRGNGKSTFAGALGVWALFDDKVAEQFGGQPMVPVIAPRLKQAGWGVYGAALGFVKAHPELSDRALIYSGAGDQRVVVPANYDGTLFPSASDADTLMGLDPMIALIDEVGFITIESWNALRGGEGKRPRNLTLGLGTRRPDDMPNALDHLLAQVEQHGGIEGLHVVDYSAPKGCAIGDRDAWRAANPALAEGFLREKTLESELKTEPEALFRTYRLNQKPGSTTGWLGTDGSTLWRNLTDSYEMESSEPTWVGIDVSLHHDATAVVHVQQRPDGRYHCIARVWFAAHNGAIPFDEVSQHIRELSLQYKLISASYDPRYFAAPAQQLAEEGIPMIEVPQSHQRMVPLIGELYRAIMSRALTHEDDPVFTAQVLAAQPRFGDTTGYSLSKLKSGLHIDACIALALALGSALLDPLPEDLTLDALVVF